MNAVRFIAACCLLSLSAAAATKDDPSITVTGEAKMRVPADQAYIILYTEESDNNVETAIRESLQEVEKVMETVKRKGSNKIKYEVVNTGIGQVKSGAQEESGYEYVASHCIRINCSPDDEDIFTLIDDATREYATIKPLAIIATGLPFSPLIYAVEEYATVEETLETQALTDAKVRAESR